MSDYGPRIESTSFDFYGRYGDERETVYSDIGLMNLVYVESPAYLVTADDVRQRAGDFTENETTDEIIRQANTDPYTTKDIRSLERAQIDSARTVFRILDNHPEARCNLDEVPQKITTRREYLETLDSTLDKEEVVRVKAQIRKLVLMSRVRKKKLKAFDGFDAGIELRRGWPLQTAVNGIVRYKAHEQTSGEPSAIAE